MAKFLRIASDLHLEGFRGHPIEKIESAFLPLDERDASSILILAGDISSDISQLCNFLKHVRPRFEAVCFVPGNHELYGHRLDVWDAQVRKELAETDVLFSTLGVEQFIHQEDTRFILGTLWSDGGKTEEDAQNIESFMRDFYVIKTPEGKKFTTHEMKRLHEAHRGRIEELLQELFHGRTIVVTHHLPSYSLCHPRFGGDLNGGFASRCDHLLAGDFIVPPDLWVHGHTHDRLSLRLFKTRIECNPRGYTSEWNGKFNKYEPALFIRLSDMKVDT